MTQDQWQKLQMAVKNRLFNKKDFSVTPIIEDHKGIFLVLIDRQGEIIEEVSHLEDGLEEISKTVAALCDELLKKNIAEEKIQSCNIQICVIREAIYLQNPLDWNPDHDGICFQWGNKYRGFYMPYEMARMKGDKIRILDRLCCFKCGCISSLWRIPEGLLFRISVDSYN